MRSVMATAITHAKTDKSPRTTAANPQSTTTNQRGALAKVATRTAALEAPEWADEKVVLRLFGLTRTPLFNLRKSGKIRSISTRGAGQSYGKRLFHLQSIRDFFAAQEIEQSETQTATEGAAQ